MTKRTVATQPVLLHVARVDTAFQIETARRGGPREISSIRYRNLKKQKQQHDSLKTSSKDLSGVIWPKLGKMPKVVKE